MDTIEQKQFDIPRLQLVKDLFVFACYTGKGYKDTKNLTTSNIEIRIEGQKWLHCERSKTTMQSDVMLFPTALEIIEKYKEHPVAISRDKLFLSLSDQQLNSYLKEIADVCSIKKNLTFCVGRHTFASTICADNGVSLETCMNALGHSKPQSTLVYYI
ncbi:MAG: integrase catalytic domain-containing protein [Bacteroidetes bacterium]|nr:integrase catalytic domain-containing protein [Bacteroidota bacterium]